MKSDHVHDTQPGPAAFTETFKPHRKLLRGGDGLSVEEFLTQPVGHWQRPRVLCRLRRAGGWTGCVKAGLRVRGLFFMNPVP